MIDDVVLAYLERLRGMTDSPRLLGHIDEVEAERREELAWRNGERIHGPGCVDCDFGMTEFHRSRTDKPNPLRQPEATT